MNDGRAMHDLMARLWPLCRSLTGDGVRRSFAILGETVPLAVHECPSGSRAFDWTVPDEWTVREAWIEAPDGSRIADFADNNLHLMSYSVPFEGELELAELKPHLHTRPDLPDAVPYVTSYYRRDWGFCLSHRQYEALRPGRYRVRVDTTLAPGSLTYADLVIPGETEDEVLLSTNICHPSMANNELSGPVMTAWLGRWLAAAPRRYTYRLVWVPETIGALVYISRHLEHLRARVVAGYQVVCTGGPGPFHYLKSRLGDTLADRAALHVLAHQQAPCEVLDYRHRESDERQYGAPGIDLPFGSLMKAKYRGYPQYHTSLDDLELVTAEQMQATFDLYVRIVETLEANRRYRTTVLGEPQLGRRDLWPNTGGKPNAHLVDDLLALLSYSDGRHDLLDIAERHGNPVWQYRDAVGALVREGLLKAMDA